MMRVPNIARRLQSAYRRDEDGAVAVEMAFMVVIMLLLTGGAVEAGYAYHQNGSAQHAVRHASRLAALSDPVAEDAASTRGTFDIACSGLNRSCSQGSFDRNAFDRIVYGADSDRKCGTTQSDRRGMCDVYPGAKPEDLELRYRRERAGEVPIVTVTLRERTMKTVVLGPLLPDTFTTLPAVSASLSGGDLDG